MNYDLNKPFILVLFGGTGDLTNRKLLPAIYNLAHKDMLPEDFAIVAIGRRNLTREAYTEQLKTSVSKFSRFKLEEDVWDKIKHRLYYLQFDLDQDSGYKGLSVFLEDLDKSLKTSGNYIYYLAVAPEYFGIITDKLHEHNLSSMETGEKNLVIEKPFGKDLISGKVLNEKISAVFPEKNIYRIDHYLGKEMIQNIMILRFSNILFEPLWNNKYIDNIQITSSETVGIESRGSYYESSGALRDMIQNHILQLLTLTAMEPPVNLNTESIRDEKVKILKAMEPITPDYVRNNMVRGQYGGGDSHGNIYNSYREEDKVSPSSSIETYAALKLHVNNFRWAGVPFYIRTGKRLKSKFTGIVIEFKKVPKVLYGETNRDLMPNLLIIKIQPEEGIYLQFNGKEPGSYNNIVPVTMDFCQSCNFLNNSPEAYERLLGDIIKGDSTLFTRWDEVENSWKFVDSIMEIWRSDPVDFPNYESGTNGPSASNELLEKDNRRWWNI
ncbi:MAG TPA: glucose-6-phosphate dehydrogenase [Clostridiaceae bacterium]